MDNRLVAKKNDVYGGIKGLTKEEVKQSREKYGENRISKKKRKGFFHSFIESFGDPVIKILMIALAINIIFLFKQSSWLETVGIAIAILLATLVSTVSEYGSESAFEKLQEEAARIDCRVHRAEGLVQIPINQIVVGDIVLLQSGDKIPADGIIMKGTLEVDQSPLNGESKEAKKFPQQMKKPGLDKRDFLDPGLLFSGTVVCAGDGLMRVTQVGDKTFFGRIGAEIQEETRESPLKVRLKELAESIGKLGYIAAMLTALAYFFNNVILACKFDPKLIATTCSTWSIMFPHLLKASTLAVAVIVMAVPEGLPMMITVVLSANMKRMLKDNVLVRKLVGLETAGSLNILFTDKTGTLTRGKLDVTHYVCGNGKVWKKNEVGSKQLKLWEILRDSIQYNCAASMSGKKAIGGNATDRAMLEFVSNLQNNNKHINVVNVVPFSSDLKYMSSTVIGDWNATLIKGAPEKILPNCTKYYNESGTVLPLANKSKLNNILKQFTARAVRIIAVAVVDNTGYTTSQAKKNSFDNLILVGLLGIRDDIRPEAIVGVENVQRAGIQTVMITGDSSQTAYAIANEVGLIKNNSDIIITSDEMKMMTDEVLSNMLPDLRVVARALPSDKSRLVRIAQAKGLVVGMTGDGVNDAPALRQADIGFAMGSGTEVAKEAGDIVILDDNFMSISKAICYGRTIFKSIRKFIIYQLSICMSAVGVTVIGPLIGVDSPITVIQMLWINIVMDTLAGLAFSGEKARISYMYEPPKSRNEKIINPYMKNQMAVISIYSTILYLAFLKSRVLQNVFNFPNDSYKMTAFFALFMFTAIFTSFCARTHKINLLDYLSGNKPFLWIMGVVTVIQILIIYYGGPIFRTIGLELNDLVLVILLAFTVIPIDIIRKYIFNRNGNFNGT